MNLITLYARLEPTTDTVALRYCTLAQLQQSKFKDVVLYEDRACTRIYCRYSWQYSDKPKRNKTKEIYIDYCRYKIKWI